MERPLALAFVLCLPMTSGACMGIGKAPVRFAGQTNIVVWDEARGVEHFVRDARFEASSRSLGFIAPSPTQPTIGEVSRDAFARLAALNPTRPRTAETFGTPGGFGGAGGVSVVERKVVAGYEATVLKASDAAALGEWLRTNGYSMPAYAERWAARYVRAGWYLTAFKVAVEGGMGSTGPVRMSFRTSMPFNPYSVPAENSGKGDLSLYYVSAGSEQPKIGRVSAWLRPNWEARIDGQSSKALAADLRISPDAIPQGSTVSFYRDPGFGRPGLDDLYFVPTPRPIGRQTMLAGLGLFAFAFVRVGRRR